MRTGDFELCIVGGHEQLNQPVIEMRHAQVYQLSLVNHGTKRCDATVRIDGKPVGTWRVPASQHIVLEHPVDQTGKFTFFVLGTSEADATNIQDDALVGLVEAIFTPEKQENTLRSRLAAPAVRANFLPGLKPAVKQDVGGTGLSGKSEQQYGHAERIEYDRAAQVSIQVRLVPAVAPLAKFESEEYSAFACPDCGQLSRVPVGLGKVRVECPHCSCGFSRQT